MADPLSYNQLLEKGKEIDELLQVICRIMKRKKNLNIFGIVLSLERNLNLMQLLVSLKIVINKFLLEKKKL